MEAVSVASSCTSGVHSSDSSSSSDSVSDASPSTMISISELYKSKINYLASHCKARKLEILDAMLFLKILSLIIKLTRGGEGARVGSPLVQ